MLSTTVPVARFRFNARWLDDVGLPDYAGSLLRGQFGAALRQLACMTRQPSCMGCPLQWTCPYPRIFEAPAPSAHSLQHFSNIPNAYVMEPPALDQATQRLAGEMLSFDMVLIGKALEQWPLVLLAWQRALAKGLTSSRSRAELLRVDWLDAQHSAHPIWQHDAPNAVPSTPVSMLSLTLPAPEATLASLTLNFQTPLRLQHQGQPLAAAQLTPRALLAALARRVALVLEFHAGQSHWGQAVPEVVRLAERLQEQRDLHWHDWTRYSSRQQQTMTLGGVLGRWHLQADTPTLKALWPWLWLGQWLHIGKNATMGMGAYTLEINHEKRR